jgi:O-antigen/teichoic acid export membrane protein
MGAVKQSQLIAKNVLAGGLSIAIYGILNLVLVAVVARRLSISDFGIFSFITLFAFVVQRVADGGLSVILMRDLAVKPERISEVLGALLVMAWAIVAAAVVVSGVALAVAHPLGYDRRLVGLIVAMGIIGLGDFIGGCWGAVLRAREDQEIFGLGFALQKAVTLALVFPILSSGFGLTGIVFAHLAGTLVRWWLYRWVVCRRYARPRLRLDLGLCKYLVLESIPIGVASLGRLLGDQADLIILGLLAGSKAVGLFSGPYRMVAGLGFVPQAIMIALTPLYARAAAETDKRPFQQAYERGVKIILLLAFPVGTVLLVCPEALTVGLLGAQYRAAAPVMRLMSVGVWMTFTRMPFPFLLAVLNQQRFLLISTVIDLTVRIVLDFLLIPRYGYIAVCPGLIFTEAMVIVGWSTFLWLVKGFTLPVASILWRPLVGSLVAGLLLHAMRPASLLSVAALSAVCGAIYLACVLMLGALSRAERELAYESLGFLQPLLGWPRGARGKV